MPTKIQTKIIFNLLCTNSSIRVNTYLIEYSILAEN